MYSFRLRLHGTGPEPFRNEPNRTGSASVYTGLFWNQSGTDPNGRIQNWTCRKVGLVLDPFRLVPKRSRVNRRPIRFDFHLDPVPCKLNIALAVETCGRPGWKWTVTEKVKSSFSFKLYHCSLPSKIHFISSPSFDRSILCAKIE